MFCYYWRLHHWDCLNIDNRANKLVENKQHVNRIFLNLLRGSPMQQISNKGELSENSEKGDGSHTPLVIWSCFHASLLLNFFILLVVLYCLNQSILTAILIFLVSLFSLMLENGLSAPQHSVYLGLAVLPLPWLFFLPPGCSIKLVTLRADMDRSA